MLSTSDMIDWKVIVELFCGALLLCGYLISSVRPSSPSELSYETPLHCKWPNAIIFFTRSVTNGFLQQQGNSGSEDVSGEPPKLQSASKTREISLNYDLEQRRGLGWWFSCAALTIFQIIWNFKIRAFASVDETGKSNQVSQEVWA